MCLFGTKGWSLLPSGATLCLLIALAPAASQDPAPREGIRVSPKEVQPAKQPDSPAENLLQIQLEQQPEKQPDKQPVKPPEKQPDKQPEKQPGKSLLDLDIEQLGNVPVRPQQGGVTSTPSGTLITPTQSESAQSSTAELFSRSSSVTLKRTSALGLDPRVRGYHSGQINANASGMTQYRSRIDIDSLFSQIDAGNVESVNVVDGPYTSLYGPGFGFLSVDLIQPRRYADGFENHFSTLFTYGTNGSTLYNRDRVWGGGPNWGYDISYGLRVGSDYTSGGGLQVPSSYNQQDVFAAFSFDLSRESRIDLNYIRMGLRNVELPGVAYDINRQTSDQFNVRWVLQEDANGPEQAVVQFWAQRTPFDGDSTRPSKQDTFYRTMLGVSNFEGSLPLVNTFGKGLTESWGVRALRTFGVNGGPLLTIGADYRHLRQQYLETDINDLNEVSFGGNFFGIPRTRQDDIGILTHLKVPVTDMLDLTLGGRFDHARTALNIGDPIVQQTPNEPSGYFRAGFNEPSYNLFMGYGTAEFRPWDFLKFNAGVGYAMRAPNPVELYNDEPYQPIARFGNSFADGNSNLAPERNIQFDLGTTFQRNKILFGVRGFYSIVQDYILPIPSDFSSPILAGNTGPTNLHRDYSAFGIDPNNPDVNSAASNASLAYRYTNIARATLAGGEVRAQYGVSDWITITADLAYVKGVNHSPSRYLDATNEVVPVKGAEGLPGIYPFNATVRVLIAEPEENRWGVEVVARMVHGQDYVADSLGELPTDGFTEFDLHGYYQINKNFRVFGSILNLFDRDYTEHGSLAISNPQGTMLRFVPERGFTLMLGVEARY